MSSRGEKVVLDLIGPASHQLTREPGVGSVSIGPGRDGWVPDLVVAPDAVVQWEAFDEMQTPAGSLWPRVIDYEGHDLSIFAWSERRPVEDMSYVATADVEIDLSRTRIHNLAVVSRGHRLVVTLPPASVGRRVTFVGDPADFTLRAPSDGLVPRLAFQLPPLTTAEREPAPADGSRGSRTLPSFPELSGIRQIDVKTGPLDVPFDVSSLLQFPDLENVTLEGAYAHWEALERLPLRVLALRFVPDLTGFPALSSWEALDGIIVWNCDADASRSMRSQLKKLHPSDGYRSVSQPRKRSWFLEEYGLPFAAWPTGTARKATAAFKAAAKTVKAATSVEDAAAAIHSFTAAANAFPGIETGEREDLADAIILLCKLSGAPIPETDALAIFNAERTF